MSNNSFEVQFTLRLYNPATLEELSKQLENSPVHYRNKNEFVTELVELGLKENRKKLNAKKNKLAGVQAEENDLYSLLLSLQNHIAQHIKSLYLNNQVFRAMLSAIYNMLLALNDDEQLIKSKIDDGFFDDLPARFEKLIADLEKFYCLF